MNEVLLTLQGQVGYILASLAGVGLLFATKQTRKAVGALCVLIGTLLIRIGVTFGADKPKIEA